MIRPLVRLGCVIAGGMDVVTGLLLVAAPSFTLGLMLVSEVPAEPIWIRFIGAFVTGVGALYFLALSGGGRRLRPLMEATALVRACIACFVGGALLSGALSLGWLSVVASDAGLAALQLVLLRKGWFDARA